MLGVTSGTFRNKSSYCMGGNFPHCCCRGYIFVSEWWENCPAHTKKPLSVQLRGTGAAGAGAHSASKTGSGKKKSSLRGLVWFLWMNSAPDAGCQSFSSRGSMQMLRSAQHKEEHFQAAVLQEHMERAPCAFAYGCWTKESRDHRAAGTCHSHWSPEVLWE